MMLGFQPDAPNDRLYIDPALPDWMNDLKVTDLKIGGHHLDIDFWRDGTETRWRVTKGEAARVVQRSYATGPERPS
jgi:hypothetical protein